MSYLTYRECPHPLRVTPYGLNALLLSQRPEFDGSIGTSGKALGSIPVKYEGLNVFHVTFELHCFRVAARIPDSEDFLGGSGDEGVAIRGHGEGVDGAFGAS